MHECAKDRHIFRKILSHRVPAVSLRQRRTAASEQRGDWPAITCACATRAILNPSPVISSRSSVHGLSHRVFPNETVCRITLLLTSTPYLINKRYDEESHRERSSIGIRIPTRKVGNRRRGNHHLGNQRQNISAGRWKRDTWIRGTSEGTRLVASGIQQLTATRRSYIRGKAFNAWTKMDTSLSWILAFALIALLVSEGWAIDCFKCVSIDGDNKPCDDPFHNNGSLAFLESPCLGGRKGRDGLFPATACIKIAGIYDESGVSLTVRSCALDSGTLTTDSEIIRMSHCGGFYFDDKYVRGCVQSCNDADACNGSTRRTVALVLLTLSIFLGLIWRGWSA